MAESKMPARIWTDPAFGEKVAPSGDCLVWLGYVLPNGYGQHRRKYVHRIAYEEHVGKILPGLTIDHICKNRRCVNPDHLRMLPAGDNSLLGSSPPALNKKKRYCSNGHPLEGDNILIIHRPDGTRRKCRVCDRQAKQRKRDAANAAALSSWEAGQ